MPTGQLQATKRAAYATGPSQFHTSAFASKAIECTDGIGGKKQQGRYDRQAVARGWKE